jgi:lipid II:glycine glycyltransferase (peptidoglycan interpeptide bridge formation enzyme)
VDISVLDEGARWDELILDSDYSSVFHKWSWLQNISEKTDYDFIPLVASKGDEIKALMPVFLGRRSIFKLLFSPPPHTATPYLGPVFIGYENLRQSRRERLQLDFMDCLQKYIKKKLKPDYEFITTTPGLLDIRAWQWNGYSAQIQYDYIFDLTVGVEVLYNGIKRKYRNEIEKAKKAGIEVRRGKRKEYASLMESGRGRYGEQGIIVQETHDYLSSVYDRMYPENLDVVVAELDGEIVGGMVELKHDQTVMSWIGGVKPDIKGLNPNTLVHWICLKEAAESGMKWFVELGANTRHLCRFKRRFNPIPIQYFNLRRYPNPSLYFVEAGYLNVIKPLRGRVKENG